MMTDEEYEFLLGSQPMDHDTYHRIGIDCYEQGYIDDFGMMTPKGTKEAHDYEFVKRKMDRKK